MCIDTEFLWERTYAPLICLVQINVDGQIVVADPLDGIDLEPVAEVIEDPAVEIVMHAPHADLVAFAMRYDTTPSNVFDTQLAAGFAGLSAGLSYEKLVLETIGVRVQPSESFSDWSRRPLSAKQLRYAAEDVEHLPAMTDHIVETLTEMGRLEWAQEELARRFTDRSRLGTRPEEAWRKVSRRGKLGGRDLSVLRELAAWRERTARRRDTPASWVIKDPTLVELARRKPRTAKDAVRVRGVDAGMRASDQNDLIKAVELGLTDTLVEDSSPPPRMVRRRVTVAKGLTTALLRARCEGADIASELVGTSADVEDLIAWVATSEDQRDPSRTPALLLGWRAEFGNDLVDLIEGRVRLRLTEEDPFLVIEQLERPDGA